MSDIPQGLLYTEEHEYLKQEEDGLYVVGITEYAQGELGDIVFLELPSAGDTFERMETFGTIEAVKAVSDLFSPISGEITEVNSALDDDPSLVNTDPYGAGWMVKIRATNPSEVDALLAPEDYRLHIGAD